MSDDNATSCPPQKKKANSPPTTWRRTADIADLDGDIEIVENSRASRRDRRRAIPGLSGASSARWRGPWTRSGTDRLAVQTETGERSRLMLDIAGFRAERGRLRDIAQGHRRVLHHCEAVKLDAS